MSDDTPTLLRPNSDGGTLVEWLFDALTDVGALVPVKPDLDVMAGFLSTIDFTPSKHHPETMRPIVAEMLRIGLGPDLDVGRPALSKTMDLSELNALNGAMFKYNGDDLAPFIMPFATWVKLGRPTRVQVSVEVSDE